MARGRKEGSSYPPAGRLEGINVRQREKLGAMKSCGGTRLHRGGCEEIWGERVCEKSLWLITANTGPGAAQSAGLRGVYLCVGSS